MSLPSGWPSSSELGDSLEDLDYGRGGVVDPTHQLAPLVTPGLPIAVNHKRGFRGRRDDAATIEPVYVSKGVLPL